MYGVCMRYEVCVRPIWKILGILFIFAILLSSPPPSPPLVWPLLHLTSQMGPQRGRNTPSHRICENPLILMETPSLWSFRTTFHLSNGATVLETPRPPSPYLWRPTETTLVLRPYSMQNVSVDRKGYLLHEDMRNIFICVVLNLCDIIWHHPQSIGKCLRFLCNVRE